MSNPNINEVLSLLDVKTMAERFAIRHVLIRETYVPKKIVVSNYDEFIEIIVDYFKTHFLGRLNLKEKVDMPEHFAHDMVREILEKSFQGEGGFEYAYNICKLGIDGGMKTVLDKIYEVLLREEEERYTEYVLDKALGLEWESRVEMMRQYIKRFGHNLPDSASLKSPERLALNCKEIIRNHVRFINRLRTRLGTC
jgi:hypothetical protein